MLEMQAGTSLLRSRDIAALTFAARRIGHRMGLIEHDDAVEVLPEPLNDLADPAGLARPRLRAQGCVGREQYALGEPDWRPLPVAGQGRHK